MRESLQGKAKQLVTQDQLISPENINKNIIQANQAIFRNIQQLMKKEAINLKEHTEGHTGRFGGRKEKEEVM